MVHVIDRPFLTTASVSLTRESSLEIKLEVALEHARRLTDLYGTNNVDVAVAWETVEELLKAKAQEEGKFVSDFDRYCALNPQAPECRVYDT